MYGAILGDIIGCPYEFDDNFKTKDFPLFHPVYSVYTDDTVLTVAVADALMSVASDADTAEIMDTCRYSMQKWGKKYNAGYGDRFSEWLLAGADAMPYGSYGNGSAMRVSPAGWLYDTLERTREVAEATAAVSHNHPEGIKGAVATASIIFLARTGHSKQEIKDYVIREFGYDLSRSLDEIRPGFVMDETCQGTMPAAITAFLEGTDFEDVIRNAVSLGGDADTTGAIAGSMAEAFFGVPENLKIEANKRIEPDMKAVLRRFIIKTISKQKKPV